MSDAHFNPRRRAQAVWFTDKDVTDLTALYEKGLSDPEIAEKMGVTKGVIKYQRHKHRLLHLRLFTDRELIDLHYEGYNDREIGEKIGASASVVFYHRKRLGIKANRYIALDRTFTDSQLVELHKRGLNDREIADALGVKKLSINYYRRKLGLESNYRHT